MKDLQTQIAQVEEKKAARLLEQQAERDAYRKELEDYEKRKEKVKEELKRQYEEILLENQRVADLRTEKEIVEENNNQELRQAVEELEQESMSPKETEPMEIELKEEAAVVEAGIPIQQEVEETS